LATDFYTYRQDIRAAFGGSPVAYEPDTGVTTLVRGEMLAISASTHKVKQFVRDGSAGVFVGISRDSQVGLAKLGNQPALAASLGLEFSVFTTGVHELLGTAGQTYTHGLAVYMGADTDVITSVAGTGGVQVGIVWLPDASSKVGAVRVPVLIDEYTKTQV
jgi:hypothetical protein